AGDQRRSQADRRGDRRPAGSHDRRGHARPLYTALHGVAGRDRGDLPAARDSLRRGRDQHAVGATFAFRAAAVGRGPLMKCLAPARIPLKAASLTLAVLVLALGLRLWDLD